MIKVVKVAAYTWSNVFSEHPVLGVTIERGGEVPHVMGSELAACQVKLAEMFVALTPCQVDANEAAWIDFLEALKLGRVLELEALIGGIAIGLQALEDGRVPRVFGFKPLSDSGQSVVFVAYHFRRTAVAAVLHAAELVNLMLNHPRDCVQEVEQWKKTFQAKSAVGGLDILLREMIEAAEVRGIPWRVIDAQVEMIGFGHGKKLIRYCGGLSDADSALAQRIASNRIATFSVLNERQIALVPMRVVNSLEQVEPTLAKMAYPLLISSAVRGDKEREFHFFYHEEEVREESRELLKRGAAVIFQRMSSAQAKIYHLLVVGGEFCMALSLGENGQMEEVAKVHPDNVRLAERASALIGLKMAEVVLLAEDLSESWLRVSVKLVDVEFEFFSRKKWSIQQRAKVASAMLAFLFPGDQNGRIPIAAVTGTNGKTTTCLMLDHILRASGRSSGVATTEGVRVAGKVNNLGDAAAGQGARAIFEDSTVEFAVLETARGGLLDEGMAFDGCEVSAVLNVTADHLGLGGIETLQQLAALKGRVARAARDLVVLNADDPLTLSMVKEAQARRVALVSLKAESGVIEKHVREGGIGLMVEGEAGEQQVLKLLDGTETHVIATAGDVPATLGGRAQHNVFNALVASGLSYGLGLSTEQIAAGLKSFRNDFASNPGRFNVVEAGDFTVIIDFAHNPEGIEVACDTVARMEVAGRCWVVLGTTGNRHGDHIERAAQVVAGRFDRYLCTRDNTYSLEEDGVRGFPAEEIPKRLADELSKQGVKAAEIEEVSEFRAAVTLGLDSCAEGDLLLIFTDEYDWCHERVVELREQKGLS